VGETIQALATFTDAGSADTHTATIQWGDGTTSTVTAANGQVSATHSYAQAGLYPVVVTIADDDGATVSRASSSYLVVFDAAAGWVTGGGFLDDATTKGKGNGKTEINVSVQYRGDDRAPTGQLRLVDKKGDLDVTVERFGYMVVVGNRAFLAGTATMAGQSAPVQVLVAITDGDAAGGDGTDRVRARITSASGAVLWDTQPGALDVAGPTAALSGGNVTVHAR
jgi:hypothetical protein